ncbi:PqqD family protein [Actinoalloteichus sp. AHMU CJ021]|uniref:PqqD family peptide modification chaperone n=1 Tax=Actinoalloteichus TaxID=65496 RepID=UPI0009DEF7C9|nr:PqqD family protein [Actinoalloteichus sp. AHMU CJ021]
MSTSKTKVRLARRVTSTPVGDGLTLLDERRGVVYHLNETGAIALSALLRDGHESAVTALCTRYATTAAVVQHDVTRLLDTLLARRLVVNL